jgi:predicted Zn-dependent protease with MMP-like domain
MLDVNDEQFETLISKAIDRLPKTHLDAIKNVAIVYQDEPTELQREELQLHCNQSLFGLYEGVALTRRQGSVNNYPPDKITIFKQPMLNYVQTMEQLEEQVNRTVWHEVAHYFGLDHEQIHRLEHRG